MGASTHVLTLRYRDGLPDCWAVFMAQDVLTKNLSMQLLEGSDASIEENSLAATRYQEYVASYVMSYPTEWVAASHAGRMSGAIFLRR